LLVNILEHQNYWLRAFG